jgi:hypothetical protein
MHCVEARSPCIDQEILHWLFIRPPFLMRADGSDAISVWQPCCQRPLLTTISESRRWFQLVSGLGCEFEWKPPLKCAADSIALALQLALHELRLLHN